MKIEAKPTIFCDIDGTLVKHAPVTSTVHENYKLEVLDGTIEKLAEWELKGYKIILTTGRKESLRYSTEKQLREAGIFYDMLIMGIGGGVRYLINDRKSDGTNACHAISLDRNKGIKNLDI